MRGNIQPIGNKSRCRGVGPHRLPGLNHAIRQALDSILTRAGMDKVAWQPVPKEESRQHEQRLWDSIKR